MPDPEDLDTLGQMIQLGAQYIAEQDEPDDQPNIPPMTEALRLISGLVPGEIAENELADDEPDSE